MMIDVIMPKNNESGLILAAEKLGFKELILLYSVPQKPTGYGSTKLITRSAILINDINASGRVEKNFDIIFAPVQRMFFENNKTEFIIADSELDDVMCSLAKIKDKIIVFNTKELSKDKSAMRKAFKNAKLCKKHKLKTLFASFASTPLELRAPKDLEAMAKIFHLLQ